MLYHQALYDSLQFVLNNPDHQLLVSIQTVNYERIFVTKKGHIVVGSGIILITVEVNKLLFTSGHFLTKKRDRERDIKIRACMLEFSSKIV